MAVINNLKLWWSGLAQREQQIIFVAVIVMVIGIFYWGIWTPISEAQRNAQRELQAQQQTLAFVKQTASKIMSLRQGGARSSRGGSLSAIVSSAAGQYGLEITRMQPQGNKIQLWMDDVPFESLLSYLSNLVQQKGLSLDSLDVTATDIPGYVQVRRIQLSQ